MGPDGTDQIFSFFQTQIHKQILEELDELKYIMVNQQVMKIHILLQVYLHPKVLLSYLDSQLQYLILVCENP